MRGCGIRARESVAPAGFAASFIEMMEVVPGVADPRGVLITEGLLDVLAWIGVRTTQDTAHRRGAGWRLDREARASCRAPQRHEARSERSVSLVCESE